MRFCQTFEIGNILFSLQKSQEPQRSIQDFNIISMIKITIHGKHCIKFFHGISSKEKRNDFFDFCKAGTDKCCNSISKHLHLLKNVQ